MHYHRFILRILQTAHPPAHNLQSSLHLHLHRRLATLLLHFPHRQQTSHLATDLQPYFEADSVQVANSNLVHQWLQPLLSLCF